MNKVSELLCLTVLAAGLSSCGHFKKQQEPAVLPDSVEAIDGDASTYGYDAAAGQNAQTLSIRKERKYQSRLIDKNFNAFLYSLNRIDLDWPVELDSCNDIAPLHAALLKELFGEQNATSVDAAVEKSLSRPLFAENGVHSADGIIIKRIPEKANLFSRTVSLRCIANNSAIACYEVGKESMTAGAAHGMHSTTYVLFGKKGSKVFNADAAFGARNKRAVLSAINSCIRRINRETGTEHTPAENIASFYPTAEGLNFVYQPYEIDCYAAGIITIAVPYNQIQQYFSSGLKAALANREILPAALPAE